MSVGWRCTSTTTQRTAALLARNGIPAALVSWPRNRDLDYPAGVTRCDDLVEVRALIEELSQHD